MFWFNVNVAALNATIEDSDRDADVFVVRACLFVLRWKRLLARLAAEPGVEWANRK